MQLNGCFMLLQVYSLSTVTHRGQQIYSRHTPTVLVYIVVCHGSPELICIMEAGDFTRFSSFHKKPLLCAMFKGLSFSGLGGILQKEEQKLPLPRDVTHSSKGREHSMNSILHNTQGPPSHLQWFSMQLQNTGVPAETLAVGNWNILQKKEEKIEKDLKNWAES